MVGGIVTSTIMELMVYPAIFYVWRRRSLPQTSAQNGPTPATGAIAAAP
jgi:Cu(I)/Ag(I) efflux system membrane protein CusA/SilA